MKILFLILCSSISKINCSDKSQQHKDEHHVAHHIFKTDQESMDHLRKELNKLRTSRDREKQFLHENKHHASNTYHTFTDKESMEYLRKELNRRQSERQYENTSNHINHQKSKNSNNSKNTVVNSCFYN